LRGFLTPEAVISEFFVEINLRSGAFQKQADAASRPLSMAASGALDCVSHSSSKTGCSSTKMTSQMQAVMRLMTGKERTIVEKNAICNRPTWEQYKEDNQVSLNLR
jgi:hypothetical protein